MEAGRSIDFPSLSVRAELRPASPFAGGGCVSRSEPQLVNRFQAPLTGFSSKAAQAHALKREIGSHVIGDSGRKLLWKMSGEENWAASAGCKLTELSVLEKRQQSRQ